MTAAALNLLDSKCLSAESPDTDFLVRSKAPQNLLEFSELDYLKFDDEFTKFQQ